MIYFFILGNSEIILQNKGIVCVGKQEGNIVDFKVQDEDSVMAKD